jgi:hypothetical protein
MHGSPSILELNVFDVERRVFRDEFDEFLFVARAGADTMKPILGRLETDARHCSLCLYASDCVMM